MAKTQTTFTIAQVESLLALRAQLDVAFPGVPVGDVVDALSLLTVGQVTHPASASGGTKGDHLIQMLSRSKGATLDDVINEFGIKRNSAYARISVETRKRGLKVDRTDGHYRVHA